MPEKISQVISSLMENGLARTGASTGNGGAVSLPIKSDVARTKLESQAPTTTDRNLLAWLESSLNVVAKPQSRMMFPASGGYFNRVEGFNLDGLTAANRNSAIDAVEAAMTRPTMEGAEELVASLHAATARRGDDAEGQSLAMSLYAGCLAQYPADIAKSVCMAFALRRARPNWFPTLSEIDEACERASAQRAALLVALKAARVEHGVAA